ncbi:MAG: hypothetical protein KatS3mg104_1284 [Phycisphaerae bacterium]|nr:MAG: hypothetical protein KatS3mg104_1284 [Phycisphaerae bacterium]
MSQRRRAFTLVEILMVVLILGIIGALIIPQIGQRDDIKLGSAARVMIADLSYAQSQSITSRKRCFVFFGSDQYQLKTRPAPGQPLQDLPHPVQPGNYVTTFHTGPLSGVSIIEADINGLDALSFDEMGSPLAYDANADTSQVISVPARIRMQSGSQILTILIEPYTGQMSVLEGSG